MHADGTMLDVVIIGGGPAGLQAALTLGRIRRDTVLIDSGEYRNAPASHMHSVLTHDDREPGEFRRLAREELAAYDTVRVVDDRVVHGELVDDGVLVHTADGRATCSWPLTSTSSYAKPPPQMSDLLGEMTAGVPLTGHGLSLSLEPETNSDESLVPHASVPLEASRMPVDG